MHAFDDNYPLAKIRFQASYNPKETADTPLLWNDYVAATLAFLNKDADKLRLHRDKIANGPVWNGVRANLNVVNALLNCIDKPYSFAYSDPSCMK